MVLAKVTFNLNKFKEIGYGMIGDIYYKDKELCLYFVNDSKIVNSKIEAFF